MAKKFIIPVEWAVYSTVEVEANSVEEALKMFNEKIDDLPLPVVSEYIDGSFKLAEHDGESDETYVEMAQDFRSIGNVVITADGEIVS